MGYRVVCAAVRLECDCDHGTLPSGHDDGHRVNPYPAGMVIHNLSGDSAIPFPSGKSPRDPVRSKRLGHGEIGGGGAAHQG